MVNPQTDAESLLANACESLASATVMLGDFAGTLEGPSRNTALGIAQVVMLGELAVSQALDNVVPKELALTVLASSRASPLPQWICVGHRLCVRRRTFISVSLLAIAIK
jgi:hypothetical protein